MTSSSHYLLENERSAPCAKAPLLQGLTSSRCQRSTVKIPRACVWLWGEQWKVYRRLGRKRASAHKTVVETELGSLGISVSLIFMEVTFLPLIQVQSQGYNPANSIWEASWVNTQAAMRPGSCVPCGQHMENNQVWCGKPCVSTSHPGPDPPAEVAPWQRHIWAGDGMLSRGASSFVRTGYVMCTDMAWKTGNHSQPTSDPQHLPEDLLRPQIIWLKELSGNSTKGLADNAE